MPSDPLLAYIKFATVLVRRDRLLHHLFREQSMTTPSAIDRITTHAERAGKLMKDTDQVGNAAGPILDEYEKSLQRFKAGVAAVDEKRKALDKVLPAFGNAGEFLDAAFQNEKPPAAETSGATEQQVVKPEDTGTVEAVLDGTAPKS